VAVPGLRPPAVSVKSGRSEQTYGAHVDMGKMTPSQARNAIKRALSGVLDPHPNASQVHRIWAFFDSSCAYCGKKLVRGDRDGHIDHLVPLTAGGSNALSNFVLACNICNGDEKRDQHWEAFLHKKAADKASHKARKDRVEKWMASCETTLIVAPALSEAMNQEIEHAVAAFDFALARIRQLKTAPNKRLQPTAARVTIGRRD
jgi:5-methylcytosine-specific restriction endonuclease McrA